MNDKERAKERADAMRREAVIFEQSDRARAHNLRRDADELDQPQAEQPAPAKKHAKPRKRGRQ